MVTAGARRRSFSGSNFIVVETRISVCKELADERSKAVRVKGEVPVGLRLDATQNFSYGVAELPF
jgi:hypothetical protein